MTVGKDEPFTDAIECGDVAVVLRHHTFARGGIAPISSHGDVR
jgi:hypothetical protein